MRSIVGERDRIARRRALQFLGLAVLLHLAALPMLSEIVPKPGLRRYVPVRVVSLGSQNPVKKRPSRAPRRPEPKPEEEKVEQDKLDGQVVDIPPTGDDTPPEEADYLSENNTRVERETRSRHQSADYANAMNERTVARLEQAASPRGAQRPQAIDIGPDTRADEAAEPSESGPDRAFELPELKQRSRLALKLEQELGDFENHRESEKLLGKGDRLRLSLGSEGKDQVPRASAPNTGPTIAELVPQAGVLARISGGPANDHLDLEEGEGTFLNSREFKFASFFNRMKRGVSQHWRPLDEYRRRDPTGNIYGQRSRVTVLNVTLNADGSLKGVEVTRSSGVEFLDREAVAAFRRAEPFPNPPKGLVDGTGQISFPFGFHLDFTARGSLQLPF